MEIIYIVLMLGVFYLIVFLPENKRKKKYNSMLTSIKVNDEVVTRGGIIGKIVNIHDDFVIIQSGPDKARFKLSKNGISSIISAKVEEEKAPVKEADDKVKAD